MKEKALSEMTLPELWRLFPIQLTGHRPQWQEWYREEEQRLRSFLPMQGGYRISHIGSTAVEAIWAKPIVDILLEINEGRGLSDFGELLKDNGYLLMSESPRRMSFNRGYTAEGFADRVFHLHLRSAGDNDELYFRDYLNSHPEVARQYELLKLRLWKKYEYDRDGYTESKSAFVKRYTQLAKASGSGRYAP